MTLTYLTEIKRFFLSYFIDGLNILPSVTSYLRQDFHISNNMN